MDTKTELFITQNPEKTQLSSNAKAKLGPKVNDGGNGQKL
jgi:hypothetical protein